MLMHATEDALAQISDALASLAEGLQRMRSAPGLEPITRSVSATDASAGACPVSAADLAVAARRYLKLRRQRDELCPGLFEDPAWDILLDLYAAKVEARIIYVTSACIAASVPPTTALRMISRLVDLQWISQSADRVDGRRKVVAITSSGENVVKRFLCSLVGNQ